MDANPSVNLQRFARDARIRANKLNFSYTINGTISTAGSNVVLNLDIIDTLGKTLWSGRMEKPRDNIMELPTELARTIAQVFSISLPQEAEDVVSRRVTTNAEAYLSYLRGREMLNKRTSASTKAALALFQQAISQDQDFAEAYAAAAYSLFHLYEAGWSDDARTLSQAEDLATKASLRRNTVEARTVLGGVYLLTKKYDAALDELNGALARMPSNTEAERIAGLVCTIGGEQGKATDHAKRAYELDPVDPDVLISAAFIHQRFGKPKEAMFYFNQALPFVGDTTSFLAEIAGNALVSSYQYDRAIGIYEQRIALNPKSFVDEYRLARAYQLAGKPTPVWSRAFEKTIANLQKQIENDPQNALAVAYLGLAYSRYGRFSEGETNGKKAVKMAANNLTVKYKLADIYSIQKKKQEAITALR